MGINQRLRSGQPIVTTVVIASGYARRLVEAEARRSREPLKVALNPVARRLKAAPGALWSLLFRPPKQISADLFAALEAALEGEIQREIRALEHELATLRATSRRSDRGTLEEVEAGIARLKAALRGRS